MPHVDCKVAIIGGGVLGMSVAYFLSAHAKSPESIVLPEQEKNIAQHSSSRNTGKVHAPFLYDPIKKKTFAKAAALGYEMWQNYSSHKRMPFKRDGVLEVALNDEGIDRLYKYMEWGLANGLTKNELQLLDKNEVARMEPNVRCASAIYCSKDASVNYGAFTIGLLEDIQWFGRQAALGIQGRANIHIQTRGLFDDHKPRQRGSSRVSCQRGGRQLDGRCADDGCCSGLHRYAF